MEFSAAALWQAPGFSYPSSPCRTALATVPPQKTVQRGALAPAGIGSASSAFARRPSPNKSECVSAFSAFLSVSKYGAVKLFESPGKAGGLPMKSVHRRIGQRSSAFQGLQLSHQNIPPAKPE
jgi:hypothetical protein